MGGNIQSALLISAIGMAIVFGVILVLWALMALVVRVASARQEEEAKPTHDPDADATKARAAAAAVAAYIAAEQRPPSGGQSEKGA